MPNQRKETFAVHGMACTGCEAVIENALRKLDGIFEVKASFAKNQVSVRYDPERARFEKLRTAVKKAGYTIEKAQDQPAGKSDEGKEKPLSTLQFAGLAVLLLAIYLIINHTVGFQFIPEVTSSMGYGVLLVAGLLTSLHCVAMCGGINLSQCIGGGKAGGAKANLRPSLLYNFGRIISYTIIGGVIGAIGSGISFSGWARGLVAILSGLFMVVMGLSMTGLFPWINRFTPRLPRIFREKADFAGRGKGPFLVGLINGFMPCGPLQAMQIYALGTGSLVAGALSMFFFSLGTLPLMFGLGAVITMLGGKFTQKMMRASAVLVAVLGVIMLSRGLALSGVSLSPFAASASASTGPPAAVSAGVEGGVQNITSSLTFNGYPNITVQKDVPVVWNLQADPGAINGCNRTLMIPKYNIRVKLQAGDNIIRFTPTESGTIPYSCWMGMQTGQIEVVDHADGKTA